jgi:putative component of toxin-antitoxin plasmid stabilization module
MQALTDKQHFDAVEAKVDKVGVRVDRLETKVDDLEKKVDAGFAEVRGEFGAIYRLMIQSFAGLGVTMILGFAALFLQQHL